MNSVDKLRTAAQLLEITDMRPSLYEIADEIERELDERYMLLPVDADGVPIRPGDNMTDGSMRADNLGVARWDVVSVNECAFFDMSNNAHTASQFTHYHPPTVESVLREMLDEYESTDPYAKDVLIIDYVRKIREVLRDE